MNNPLRKLYSVYLDYRINRLKEDLSEAMVMTEGLHSGLIKMTPQEMQEVFDNEKRLYENFSKLSNKLNSSPEVNYAD